MLGPHYKLIFKRADKMQDQAPPIANTFLIGAQKSGTTYLAALLDQNPHVCVSFPKEPRFFSETNLGDMAEYARHFADPSALVRLDASTTYSFLRPRHQMEVEGAPGLLAPVPERLRAHAPEAKLIYILRDPMKRAASACRHVLRNQPVPAAPISLRAQMQQDPMLELAGYYSYQIERYLEVFDRSQMLFIDFADLTKDPRRVVQQTSTFLGLEAWSLDLDENPDKKHGSHSLTKLGRTVQWVRRVAPGPARRLRQSLPDRFRRSVAQTVLKTSATVSFDDEAEVSALYAAERARVLELTGLTIGG